MKMKIVSFSAAICLLILFTAFTASAQITRFVGQWDNIDPNTRGISGIEITREGDKVSAQIDGVCTPTPCIGKKTEGFIYAPNVDANAPDEAVAISFDIDDGFARRIVILRIIEGKLQAETLTRFTDRSRRADYFYTETFLPKGDGDGIRRETQSPDTQSPGNSGFTGTATFGTGGNTSRVNTVLIGKTGVFANSISGGVLNGKAETLVKPEYPAAARAVRASGAVNVQVTVDEQGDIISASAVSGHPLLREAAENAARASKFAPTLLQGQPVQIRGIVVYNFVP